TFFAGGDSKQLTNLFYLPERAVASFLLAEHIVFESGLFLKDIDHDQLESHIGLVSSEYGVDAKLVKTMLASEVKSNYIINTDGSIGIMRVRPAMFNPTDAVDPFSYKENVSIGAAHLAKLIQESYDIQEALQRYYAPTSKTVLDRDAARLIQLSRSVRSAYEANGGKNNKPQKVTENAGLNLNIY
ncbi:MAG: hypothetical protein LBP51_04090, partial [Deferribacteraceae bacterium]|nr:hypothetical protein [Deferribacteraceae bacterium]